MYRGRTLRRPSLPKLAPATRTNLCLARGASNNPEIIGSEGSQTAEEGCLSVPGFREQVTRPKRVTVRAQDAKGKSFEMTGEDLLARAFMHETDHLNGTLYINHISPLKRDLIRRKVRKMQKAGEWK